MSCFELADVLGIPGDSQVSVREQIVFGRTHQSSLAIPRSLQHLINALLLHASVAVGIPAGSKYSCSPLAIATNLEITHQGFSMSKTERGF